MKRPTHHTYPAAFHYRFKPKAGILFACAFFAPCACPQNNIAGGHATDLDTIIVTGIRGSLQSSMNLKRDSIGVVDGIIAEDIGKFPDTNLAESLQRISGVSIDRTTSGEGSKVSVRGIGPDFNLVLLNGRQMPASNLGVDGSGEGSGISESRAFDFANLASEAISELEVHKTVRASMPTGGIGAVLNIKTVRPLDRPGFRSRIGIKGVMDQSVKNLPHTYIGHTITPEISGIFSNTWLDGRFGIALNGSLQERDSGFSRVENIRGWYNFRGDDDQSLFHLPQPHEPEYPLYSITNQPRGGDIYGRPLDLTYIITGVQRKRRNGQMIVQFSPTDTLTATMDYTYAQNKMQQQSTRIWTTFGHLPGTSIWTDGPVAGPIIYSERPNGIDAILMGAGFPASRSDLKSAGFNLEWDINDALKLTFDWHHSRASTLPDSPYGSNGFIGLSAFIRSTASVDFSGEMPILNMEMLPGISQLEPSHAVSAGSIFQGSFNWSRIKQGQVNGTFRFAGYQTLDFGLASTEVSNRTANSRVLRTTWGGVGTADDYADDLFQADHLGHYFKRFQGHDDPRFTDRFLLIDIERLRQRTIEIGVNEDLLRSSETEFIRNLQVIEKTSSAFLQWRNSYDLKIPLHASIGLRYEKTKVTSPSTILPPQGHISWPTNLPEFFFEIGTDPVIEIASGEYDHWLPGVDIRADLRDNLTLRTSYGKSIGRAGWGNLQGGILLINALRAQEGTGILGNPGILPLESKNFDLSLEWYYGNASYISLGHFRKNIKNFISNTTVRMSPYDVRTPVGGVYWNNAITLGGCLDADFICIREYIFTHHRDDPGVEYTGDDNTGRPTGIITGLDTDPVAEFNLTTPVNQRTDNLDGWELGVQHMFGSSGFGIAANYTKVDSGLIFDNTQLGDQYPMVGLSDTANLVVFYDKHRWQIRAAYNWRDQFLLRASDDTGPNPWYTEKYGQLDANVTWLVNERLSVSIEGINLTDRTQRIHSRHRNMLIAATQTGPRYMFGVRYKF